jgi:hypothetical protein
MSAGFVEEDTISDLTRSGRGAPEASKANWLPKEGVLRGGLAGESNGLVRLDPLAIRTAQRHHVCGAWVDPYVSRENRTSP